MTRRTLRLTEPKFFGGGGPGAQPAQQIQSLPVPTPAPPVTGSAAEVVQAQQDLAQQNLMKKSIKKTIFAGDTAFQPGQAGSPGNAMQGASPSAGYKKTFG